MFKGGLTAQRRPLPAATADDIELIPVQGNVYMIAGDGGNIALSVGDDGALLVDTGTAALSDALLAMVQHQTKRPIRYVINTSADADHVGGNAVMAAAGISAGKSNVIAMDELGATVVAHENVLRRMSAPTGQQAPWPFAAWPTETFPSMDKEVFINHEPVQVLHEPSAHTDADSIVFFRRSDVVSTGDVFVTTGYPAIDVQRGGSINGVIAALNHVIAITIPEERQEGGTYVIPGHGRICDEADVVEYRDMVTIIRDRIQDLVKKGKTLDEVKASRPTMDYDGRYPESASTPETFIEAVYSDLSRKKT
jgi:glyoxylase-like metal-dependent hydrolase (beta-lactamase superfamily II)